MNRETAVYSACAIDLAKLKRRNSPKNGKSLKAASPRVLVGSAAVDLPVGVPGLSVTKTAQTGQPGNSFARFITIVAQVASKSALVSIFEEDVWQTKD